MGEELKEKIQEFVALAKACPDGLQEKCFEILLSDYLRSKSTRSDREKPKDIEDLEEDSKNTKNDDDEKKAQEDIREADLHVKAKQFLKKTTVTLEDLNDIFYKEGEEFLPLYDDLKTTRAAESQIRIALLLALRNGMRTGDFEFSGEDVREEAQLRKCYDASNFAANFKNNSSLFEGFDKYAKSNPVVKLSSEGKERLAQTIKDLQ